jgi:hypothetical protein
MGIYEQRPDRFLSRRQQTERYGVSLKTIERWSQDQKLGYPQELDINGRKYRKLSELEAFERKCAAIPAPKRSAAPLHKAREARAARRRAKIKPPSSRRRRASSEASKAI